MAKTQARIKFSLLDYRNLPESETKRYELLGGELRMTPGPVPYHQRISRNLEHTLWEFVRDHQLGEVYFAPLDVVLSDEDVVQPDLLFISDKRRNIIQEDAIYGAPDLIVEILSPTTAERDRTYKRTLYARSGVGEYWLVDPDTHTVEVLTLEPKGYQQAGHYERNQMLNSPLLPKLKIPLNDVF